jgi:ATP-dependent Clp protease ATP-binding subunit ClpX
MIKTDNILFIGGGAFSDLYGNLRNLANADSSLRQDSSDGDALYKMETSQLIKSLQKYGMIPELLGRIPVIARLKSLTKEDLKRILITSKESVLKQYEKDFQTYGIEMTFAEKAYDLIAEKAYQRRMGARALGAVLEEVLTPLKFHLPGTNIRKIEITEEIIVNPLEGTLKIIKNQKNALEGAKNGKTTTTQRRKNSNSC